MKKLITLPFKLLILPVIIILGLAILFARVAAELTSIVFGAMILIGFILTVYCAIDHGVAGFLIMGGATFLCVLIPTLAYTAIDFAESVNARFVGFLLS